MTPLADILATLRGDTLPDDLNWAGAVARLKHGAIEPDVATFKKQYYVEGHAINDKALRRDKQVTDDEGSRSEPAVRKAIAYQQLITEKAAMFLFGLPPTLTGKPANDQEKQVFEAITKIMDKAKVDGHNKEVAMNCSQSTQVAECWYSVPAKRHTSYGFPCEFKLRVARFSPWLGDSLYPTWDETGDLVVFSRGYMRNGEDGKPVTYFEVYSPERTVLLRQDGSDWIVIDDTINPIEKIQVVYGTQPHTEWHPVQNLIERTETNLSNHGEINDYHAAPTIVSDTDIGSMSGKGEKGRILITPGKISYMTWNQAPDSVKLELDTDFMLIHKLTQTPDISFEAMKGLGAISGTALQLLFIDAHMKVEAKKLIFDPFLQRRLSIIAAYIGMFDKKLKDAAESLTVKLVIRPYQVNDLSNLVSTVMAATGGKPVMSQQTGVELIGQTDSPADEVKRLTDEAAAANVLNAFPPAE